MPLVVDQLQLWTIGFKWAGVDPTKYWIRIPEQVKDYFSTLLEAILKDHLGCMTLMPQKWDGNDRDEAPFYIRHWINDIYAGVQSQQFNRKLLQHAVIDRDEFKDWCERCTIPLPEFWFPSGWSSYRYRWDDGEETGAVGAPGPAPKSEAVSNLVSPTPDIPTGDTSQLAQANASSELLETSPDKNRRPSQKARIACQVIAANIWRIEPDRTISSMCKDERMKLGDAAFYDEVTVKRWVQQVAPASVSAKRGRPRENNPPEGGQDAGG